MDMNQGFDENATEYFMGKVDSFTPQAYRHILCLLSDLVRDWNEKRVRGCTVLPLQQLSKEGIQRMLFDLKFDASGEGEPDKLVIIRIRRDNLYIVAYHDGIKWVQFADQQYLDPNLVPKPVTLKLNGCYASLEKNSNKHKEDVYVGKAQLAHSIKSLHHSKDACIKTVALSLLTVTLMFPEPMRFHSIYKKVEKNFNKSCQLGDLAKRLNEWSTCSDALLDKDRKIHELPGPAIRDLTEAGKELKILINRVVKEEEEEAAEKSKKKTNKRL